MAPRPDTTVFLERKSYRRRRMRDGLRLLPVFAFWLFMVPLLWGMDPSGVTSVKTSSVLVYVFWVWIGMTLLSAVLNYLAGTETSDARSGE